MVDYILKYRSTQIVEFVEFTSRIVCTPRTNFQPNSNCTFRYKRTKKHNSRLPDFGSPLRYSDVAHVQCVYSFDSQSKHTVDGFYSQLATIKLTIALNSVPRVRASVSSEAGVTRMPSQRLI